MNLPWLTGARSALVHATEVFILALPAWNISWYMVTGSGAGVATALAVTTILAVPSQAQPVVPTSLPVAAISLPTMPPGATAAPTTVPTPRPTPKPTATPLPVPDPAPARAPAASPFIFVKRASGNG